MPTSTTLAAYRSLNPSTLVSIEERVLEVIDLFGEHGCTYEQVIPYFPEDMREGTIIGRIKPLESKGKIFRNGEKREGKSGRLQLVIRAICHAKVIPLILPSLKPKKNPFLDGMLFSAKIIRAHSDLDSAKKELALEARKVAAR